MVDRSLWYDRNGEPLTLEQWMVLFADEAGRVVAQTVIAPDVRVSTVWIGLDHQWRPDGPPLIFETMVRADDPDLDGECWRYTNEFAARKGHAYIVEAIRQLTDHSD